MQTRKHSYVFIQVGNHLGAFLFYFKRLRSSLPLNSRDARGGKFIQTRGTVYTQHVTTGPPRFLNGAVSLFWKAPSFWLIS